MRTRLRHLLAAALAAVTIVTVSACAAIPTDGPVRAGQTIKDESLSGVDYRPDKPVAGADQTAILRGFIAAGTGAQDDYAIARQFLSSGFSEKWNPRRGVTIRQGNPAVERVGERELTYTLTASATVDANGEYTQAVRPTSSTLTFQFTREDGEWRIAYAPDGIILSPVNFDSVFQQHALYFFDPTYKFLVPDERWFLARSSTSTRIASALLAGPADWLKGSVVSSFPEGTQLSLNAVTVDSGTALVDLSSDALRANSSASRSPRSPRSRPSRSPPRVRRSPSRTPAARKPCRTRTSTRGRSSTTTAPSATPRRAAGRSRNSATAWATRSPDSTRPRSPCRRPAPRQRSATATA